MNSSTDLEPMSALLAPMRRPITADEFVLMAEAGVFGPEERVELIEGELVAMPPIGWSHELSVNVLNRRLVMALGEHAVVSVQNSVKLPPLSMPQPDITILGPQMWRAKRLSTQDDVLLMIEVAVSSLGYDTRVKLPLYARHRIPAVWIVDVEHEVVHCHDRLARGGRAARYTRSVEHRRGDMLRLESLPAVKVSVDELFADAT
jgi:Uma2 family endonuclease